ncbi:MAG TPA: molybdenum cofactor guanylyltransferase [Opitutaceae bacterium]|nr:molybdenum cofactor guanylyltransferase [Opitutaceae bacterium]
MSAGKFSAVLLVAGRSTRMGRDKALIESGGLPAWRRQRDLLARLGPAEIFLSARPEQAEWTTRAEGFTATLYDTFSDCGPISGVTAALERGASPFVVALAIDLPRMTAAWFEDLLARCTPGVGAVGRRGKFFEPLAAVYPREMMWLAWEALAGGEYSLQRLVARAVREGLLRERKIDASEAAWFENRNEPARV